VNEVEFCENPYTLAPSPTTEMSFLDVDESTYFTMKGKRDDNDIVDNLWSE